MPGTQLLRPEDAAERLRISRSAVYKLIHAGEIASVKIGRSRRITTEALERFVEHLRSKVEASNGDAG